MKIRFFRIASLVSCFLLAAATVFAQPGQFGGNRDGNFPDISYSVSPVRGVQTDLVKQVVAMPEFKEFFDAFTAKIDGEYVKVSNQPGFPAPVVDYFLDKIRDAKGRTDISSQDAVELFCSEIELIQLEAFAKKAFDDGAIQPGQNNPEVAKYLRLTVVTKFRPAELSGILDFVPPFVPFEMYKTSENDFLVSFGAPDNSGIKLFVGGQKLGGRDSYVTVIGLNRELVEQKLTMMQNERFRAFMFGDNAPVGSLRVSRGVFDALKAEVQKKIADGTANPGDKDALRIIEQVNAFSVSTRDLDGKTNTVIRLALTNEDTAEGLKAMADGGKAMLRFMAGSENVDADARKLINFVLNTEIVRDGTNLTATINWSSDDFLQLVKDGLKKGTAEIKNR